MGLACGGGRGPMGRHGPCGGCVIRSPPESFCQTAGEHMATGLSSAGVLVKWGIPMAALAAITVLVGLGQTAGAQPTLPTDPKPPSSVPSLKPPGKPSLDPSMLNPTKTAAPKPGGNPRPLLPESINIALKLEENGTLSVTEQVFVQARKTMT